MEKLFQLSIIAIFITIHMYGQEPDYSLTIKITNLRSNEGLVGIDFLNENEVKVKGEYIPIKNKIATVTYNNLKKGKYAVRVYHDENKNDKMDFNWLMMPKEGFGYTGEKQFGYPKIKNMLFMLDKDKTVTVQMFYIL